MFFEDKKKIAMHPQRERKRRGRERDGLADF